MKSAFRVLLPASVLTAVLSVPFLDYITDDTFIHMQFARNLADGFGFSFNRGDPTYGFTSPLWVLLLAGWEAIGLDLLAGTKVLGFAFLLLGLVAVWRLGREIVPDPAVVAAVVIAWTFNCWSVRWGISGMETPLAVFLVSFGLAEHLREERTGRAPVASGLLFALATLARPECLGLIGLAAVSHLLRPDRIRRLAVLAVSAGVVMVPWMAYAYAEFGQLFPNTAHAKAGSFELELATVVRLLVREAKILGASNGGEGLLAILGAAAAWVVVRRRSGDASSAPFWVRRHFLPLAWLCALPLLYALRGSVLVSRYLLPVVPVLICYGFLGLIAIRDVLERRHDGGGRIADDPTDRKTRGLDRSTRDHDDRSSDPRAHHPDASRGGLTAGRGRLLLGALVALFAIQNLVVLYGIAWPAAVSFTRGMHESLIPIGRWLRENTPSDATVAVPDIGAIGWFSEREVVDLSGLVTPEMIAAQEGMDLDTFVATFGFATVARPDFLVDRHTAVDRFAALDAFEDVVEVRLHRKIGPLGIARADDYYYTVYEIDWEAYERAAATFGSPSN